MSIRAPLTLLTAAALAFLAVCVIPSTSEAQFGKRLKDAVKRTAEDKAIQKATDEENKAIDKALEGGADNPADTASDSAAAPAAGAVPAESAPAAAPAAGGPAPGGAASASPLDKKVWANYDFVPGQRTVYYQDFTEDVVGNFPQRLEFKTGGMEIVEFEGGQRALKASSASEFIIPLPEVLPDKFTVELDVINRNSSGVASNTFEIAGGPESKHEFTEVGWGHNGLYVTGPVQVDIATKYEDREKYLGKPTNFRILGDGKYLKLYANEKRIANIPNANFRRDKALFVRLQARDEEENAVYLTRIRVAESQKTIYDELSSKGRWTTQGILFDTGKSQVKPESTPTLKQIAATLKEHPELKIEIQGHTDNVGKADANLKLSQARSDAVKQALIGEHGANPGQLTTKGYGDTKPVGDNGTAEGRANNRRVELVKQ